MSLVIGLWSGGMVNGQWLMDNGYWAVGNDQWEEGEKDYEDEDEGEGRKIGYGKTFGQFTGLS